MTAATPHRLTRRSNACSTHVMRWEGQEVTGEDAAALPGLQRMAGLVRSVRTPEFAGIVFHEVAARSVLNKVPEASRSEEHTSELQSRGHLVCRLLLEKKNQH